MALFGLAHLLYNLAARFGLLPYSAEETAPARAGDVLLMHPFLVHSASPNYSREMRIAFNLGTRWRRDPSCVSTKAISGAEQQAAAELLCAEQLRQRYKALLRRDGDVACREFGDMEEKERIATALEAVIAEQLV
eukprot:SAG11_NODE_27_length_23309_cov_10.579362_25_plen_135_part_00